jgi:hypothetical protein
MNPLTFATEHHCSSVAISDLNDDNQPEVIITSASRVSIFRNETKPSTNSLPPFIFAPRLDIILSGASRVVVGDIDSDQKPDLIVSGWNNLTLIKNTSGTQQTGLLTFGTPVDLPTGSQMYGMAIADLDHDGNLDLINVENGRNLLWLYKNIAIPNSITTNSFSKRIPFPVTGYANEIATADFDRDGRNDFVCTVDSSAIVYRNVTTDVFSSNSFSPIVKLETGTEWYAWSVTSGDLDGDGRAELAVVNISNNTVSVFRNTSPVQGKNLTLDITQDQNNRIIIKMKGPAGKNVTLFTSTDLIQWNPLITLTSQDGVLNLDDPATETMRQRFYRAMEREP